MQKRGGKCSFLSGTQEKEKKKGGPNQEKKKREKEKKNKETKTGGEGGDQEKKCFCVQSLPGKAHRKKKKLKFTCKE